MTNISDYDVFELVALKPKPERLFELLEGYVDEGDQAILLGCLVPAKCVLIEREYIDKDYRNAYSGFYSKKFAETTNRAIRLHLFDVQFDIAEFESFTATSGLATLLSELSKRQRGKRFAGTTDGYLGYIVLRPTELKIGRCLLDPRKVTSLKGSAEHAVCLAPYTAEILGQHLSVSAFPHQSQDGEVNVCAHTAMWSLFRYLSQKYATYREHYPHDIAVLNKDLHYGRPLPGRGLSMDQVTAMFGQFGLAAEIYEDGLAGELLERGGSEWAAVQSLSLPPRLSAKRTKQLRSRDNLLCLLHTHLESGLPPVVGVPSHASVAVGVEYADDVQVVRPGRVIPSTDFIRSIIVNDDTAPPYERAYRSGTKRGSHLSYSCEDIDTLVVPLPEKLFLPAEKAEMIITDLLQDFGPPTRKDRYVRRLFTTSSKNYRAFRVSDRDPASRELLRHPLPHFMWIGELSVLSRWGKTDKAAIVEIALDATAGPYDHASFLWVRYPGFIMINFDRIYGYRSPDAGVVFVEVDDSSSLTFRPFTGNLRSFT